VLSGTALSLFLFATSLAHVILYGKRQGIPFGQSANKWRVPMAMVVYGFLIFLYPASLSGYHLFLMARGETTREYLQSHKFARKDRHRPFTQGGVWKNWVTVLLRSRAPTYLQFKKEYEEGDQRYGARKGGKSGEGGVEMHQMR
jgi:palmitoyltransferase ZDHHC9/14/18